MFCSVGLGGDILAHCKATEDTGDCEIVEGPDHRIRLPLSRMSRFQRSSIRLRLNTDALCDYDKHWNKNRNRDT